MNTAKKFKCRRSSWGKSKNLISAVDAFNKCIESLTTKEVLVSYKNAAIVKKGTAWRICFFMGDGNFLTYDINGTIVSDIEKICVDGVRTVEQENLTTFKIECEKRKFLFRTNEHVIRLNIENVSGLDI